MLEQIRWILAMRLAVSGRRHPAVPLLIAFGWIITVFLLIQTWFIARDLAGRPQLAVLTHFIAVPALSIVFVFGLPATWQLIGDGRWMTWLITRGHRPSVVLASMWIERAVRVSIGTSFVGVYLAAFYGSYTGAAAASLAAFTLACSLLLAGLQVAGALVVRALSGRRQIGGLCLMGLVIAFAYPLAARAGPSLPALQWPSADLLAQLTGHPLADWVGLLDLAKLGLGALEPSALAACGRIILRIGVLWLVGSLLLRWVGERLTRPGPPGRSLLTRQANRLLLGLLRRSRAGWGMQGGLEWILLLRQGSVVAMLWTLGALAALLFVRLSSDEIERLSALLPLVALLVAHGIGTDGVGELLGRAAPYRFYRACGTDPGDYGVGIACAASGVSLMAVLACAPILATACGFRQAVSSAASGCVLAVADAALATMISLYLQPILPRLGIVGQIKSGLILIGSAWLLLVLFSAFPPLPIGLVAVFWMFKKRDVAGFVWRRVWNADRS